MTAHITTEEAKKLSLPGSDSFKYTHLLYHDDFHRNYGSICLNLEALKAFSDTITIAKRNKLKEEHATLKNWMAQGGLNTKKNPFKSIVERSIYVNYEHLKIASGFELHLKAKMLARNYILHEIDSSIHVYKSLASEQRKRPIVKHELFAIQPYHFDGKQNYLPGLKNSSVKFSLLTDKPAYRAALGLNDQQAGIIQDYRLLRNQVHLPGDFLETPNIQAYPQPIIEFLVEFINSEIVIWTNSLMSHSDLKWKKIIPF